LIFFFTVYVTYMPITVNWNTGKV